MEKGAARILMPGPLVEICPLHSCDPSPLQGREGGDRAWLLECTVK